MPKFSVKEIVMYMVVVHVFLDRFSYYNSKQFSTRFWQLTLIMIGNTLSTNAILCIYSIRKKFIPVPTFYVIKFFKSTYLKISYYGHGQYQQGKRLCTFQKLRIFDDVYLITRSIQIPVFSNISRGSCTLTYFFAALRELIDDIVS